MRAFRLLVTALCASLVALLAPPVHATDAAPTAATYAIVDPDDDGIARVIVVCTGQGPAADSALTHVECDLYDSSGRPSIHHERNFSGPAGVCVINAFNMKIPVEYCTTVTVQYRDTTSQTAQHCGHAGGAPPAHTSPGPHTPTTLECLDPAGVGI